MSEEVCVVPDHPGDLVADASELGEVDAYDYAFDPAETVLRQLPGESDYRFAMLKRVAEMPPQDRTSRNIGEVLGIHPTNVRRARSQWRWTERLRQVEEAKDRQRAYLVNRALAEAAGELSHALLASATLARRAAENIDPETVSPSSVAQLLGATARAMELARTSSTPTGDDPPPLPEPPPLPSSDDRTMRMMRVLADRPDLLQHMTELGREADRLPPT